MYTCNGQNDSAILHGRLHSAHGLYLPTRVRHLNDILIKVAAQYTGKTDIQAVYQCLIKLQLPRHSFAMYKKKNRNWQWYILRYILSTPDIRYHMITKVAEGVLISYHELKEIITTELCYL